MSRVAELRFTGVGSPSQFEERPISNANPNHQAPHIIFTLRCTRALLKRLNDKPDPSPSPPTTKLGDWYSNILYTRPKQLILCVSERTLLPLLIEAAGTSPIDGRIRETLSNVLRSLGISDDKIEAELLAMSDMVVSTTASRTILGSMNDFTQMFACFPPAMPPFEVARDLAKSPCSPIGMNSPDRATVELFQKPALQLVT